MLFRSKKRANLKKTRIVVVTGVMRDEDSALRAHRFGADEFITKPFDVKHLVKNVDSMLSPNYRKKTAD